MVNIGIVDKAQITSILDKTEEITGDNEKMADQLVKVALNPEEFANNVVTQYRNLVIFNTFHLFILS